MDLVKEETLLASVLFLATTFLAHTPKGLFPSRLRVALRGVAWRAIFSDS